MLKYILLLTLLSSSAYAINGGGAPAALDASCQFEYSAKSNIAGDALVCKRIGGVLKWQQSSVSMYAFNSTAKKCAKATDKLITSIPVVSFPAPVVRASSTCPSGETRLSTWISGTTTKSFIRRVNGNAKHNQTIYYKASVYSSKCQPSPVAGSYSNLCTK